jgi:hypothetical protein
MSELQIRERAHSLWLEYIREVGPEYVLKKGNSFDDVYDAVIYPHYEVTLIKDDDLGVDDFGDPILGQFLPKENTALVTSRLFEKRDPRRVFTEWHEVAGHGVLHGPFLRKNARKYRTLNSTEKSMNLIENTFEVQANTFAANIAAPLNFVYCIWVKLFGMWREIRYAGPGYYDLCLTSGTNLRCYIGSVSDLAWRITDLMKHYFGGLSNQSLSYQVQRVCIEYTVNNNYKCEFAPTLGEVLAEGNNL